MTTAELNARTNKLFWERTGYKRGRVLDPADPGDREMMRSWLEIRAELAPGAALPPAPARSRALLYLAIALVGTTGVIALQNRSRLRRVADATATGARRVVAGARRVAVGVRGAALEARDGARAIARQVRQLTSAEPEDERSYMSKYGDQHRAKQRGGRKRQLALPPGGAA